MNADVSSRRRVWRSELAGAWYPADPDELRSELTAWLRAAAKNREAATPRALIVPHAGYLYSGIVAAQAYARIAGCAYRRVLVMGPSHRVPMRNLAALPDATHFETPLGAIPLDLEALARLRRDSHFDVVPGAQPGEHSVEIQFPFLQVALENFRLTPLVVGQLDETAARAIARRLAPELDADTLLVVSTDFTHYGASFGYRPFRDRVEERLRELDLGAFEFIRRQDLPGFRRYVEETGATICGRDPLSVLLALLGPKQDVQLLAYETSARVTGDWSHVVSYVAAAVFGPWPGGAGAAREESK